MQIAVIPAKRKLSGGVDSTSSSLGNLSDMDLRSPNNAEPVQEVPSSSDALKQSLRTDEGSGSPSLPIVTSRKEEAPEPRNTEVAKPGAAVPTAKERVGKDTSRQMPTETESQVASATRPSPKTRSHLQRGNEARESLPTAIGNQADPSVNSSPVPAGRLPSTGQGTGRLHKPSFDSSRPSERASLLSYNKGDRELQSDPYPASTITPTSKLYSLIHVLESTS